MNKKLVIFDLDGTLLNTIDDLAVSANYALRQHGYPDLRMCGGAQNIKIVLCNVFL